jgi:ribosome biogenesis GTPase
VVAGDRALVSGRAGSEQLAIEEVLPRANQLVRAGPGGRGARVVASNLDRCIVVLSGEEPPLEPEVVDRFLALAGSCGIPPVIVLNKMDLPRARERAESLGPLYERIGYDLFQTSAKTLEGLPALGSLLSHGVSAFVGPSGVGKSSLLNALDPGFVLRTREVGGKGGRGRHTTVSARLLPLASGGWVVDTPGFSDVRLWDVAVESLSNAFPEIAAASIECRFRGCSHLHEPGCAVREGVETGQIAPSRFASYRRMAEGRGA